MTILQIIIDNPETVQKQIKQLRDLVIEYHFTAEPFIKTYGAIIAAALVVLISIGGQFWIFRLNKNKEIKLKVAELYGKFKSKSIMYPFTLKDKNIERLINDRNKFLLKRYNKMLLEVTDELEKYDFLARVDYYKSEFEKSKLKAKVVMDNYNLLKIELTEIFHQIHFYYNDKQLDKYIEEFTLNKGVFFKEEYFEGIEEKGFIAKFYTSELDTNFQKCNDIFNRITDCILKLS